MHFFEKAVRVVIVGGCSGALACGDSCEKAKVCVSGLVVGSDRWFVFHCFWSHKCLVRIVEL